MYYTSFSRLEKRVNILHGGEDEQGDRFHRAPWNGAGLPAPTDKEGKPFTEKCLRELVGHTPTQVIVGGLFGTGVALFVTN
jgi:hypothetical protein